MLTNIGRSLPVPSHFQMLQQTRYFLGLKPARKNYSNRFKYFPEKFYWLGFLTLFVAKFSSAFESTLVLLKLTVLLPASHTGLPDSSMFSLALYSELTFVNCIPSKHFTAAGE